jgi:hypothetical protein
MLRKLFPNLAQMDGGKLMSDLGAALGFAYGDRLEAQLERPYR